jgi:hypothetical protein
MPSIAVWLQRPKYQQDVCIPEICIGFCVGDHAVRRSTNKLLPTNFFASFLAVAAAEETWWWVENRSGAT